MDKNHQLYEEYKELDLLNIEGVNLVEYHHFNKYQKLNWINFIIDYDNFKLKCVEHLKKYNLPQTESNIENMLLYTTKNKILKTNGYLIIPTTIMRQVCE